MSKRRKLYWTIANAAAAESSCQRRKVGAVAVSQDGRVVSIGYNGTARWLRNCSDGGCSRCSGSAPPGSAYYMCTCLHAEVNLVLNAARDGVSVLGTTVYTTLQPCLQCAIFLYQAGVARVLFRDDLELGDTAQAYEDFYRQARAYGYELTHIGRGDLIENMEKLCTQS